MSICTRCGAGFSCGMQDAAGEACWCTQLPPVVALPPAGVGAGCWCRACLEQHIAQSGAAAPDAKSDRQAVDDAAP